MGPRSGPSLRLLSMVCGVQTEIKKKYQPDWLLNACYRRPGTHINNILLGCIALGEAVAVNHGEPRRGGLAEV